MEKLGKYIQEYTVKNKCAEDIPVYSVTNTQGFCKDYFGKEVASKDKTTYKIVPKGYFAYNPSRINVGSVDWQRNEERVIVSPLYNVFSVSEQLHQQYLYYYLKSDIVRQFIKVIARGTVRDNLKLSMLCEFPIYVPSVLEQENIVVKLDGLQKVIKLRKQQLQKLDELIQARFVELFGDPALNPNGWEKVNLGSVCDVRDGTHDSPKYFTEGYPLVTSKNVTSGRIDFTDCSLICEEDYKKINERSKVDFGDILMPMIGTVGKPVIVDVDAEFAIKNVALIKFYDDSKVINIFVRALLQSDYFDRAVISRIRGGTQKFIALGDIRKLEICLPPMATQLAFREFAHQVDKSKLVIKNLLQIYKHQIQM